MLKNIISWFTIILICTIGLSCSKNNNSNSDYEETITTVKIYYKGEIISENKYEHWVEHGSKATMNYRYHDDGKNTRILSEYDYLMIIEEERRKGKN